MSRTAVASAQLSYGRRLRPTRGLIVLVAIVLIGLWFLAGFARTMTQLNSSSDRRAELTGETAALTSRLDAGHREVELIQTDAFQALQARSYGIGAPGEISFSVPRGDPAPRVVPLGTAATAALSRTPLESWLSLLFGD
jgi:cell division protein FtsB